jgi:hypothetical protein
MKKIHPDPDIVRSDSLRSKVTIMYGPNNWDSVYPRGRALPARLVIG